MIRMLLVGYCFGIRSERRLCDEVHLNLAYRWFCRLGLEDQVPDHSTFPLNRHGRFRGARVLRSVFEDVVRRCMGAGFVGGEGFGHRCLGDGGRRQPLQGCAGHRRDRLDRSPVRYPRGTGISGGPRSRPENNRKTPKVISLSDPRSAWTAKANKRVQFGYGLNYLIDN